MARAEEELRQLEAYAENLITEEKELVERKASLLKAIMLLPAHLRKQAHNCKVLLKSDMYDDSR